MFGPRHQWKWRIPIFAIGVMFIFKFSVYDRYIVNDEPNQPKRIYAMPERGTSSEPFTESSTASLHSAPAISQQPRIESSTSVPFDSAANVMEPLEYCCPEEADLAQFDSEHGTLALVEPNNPTSQQTDRSQRLAAWSAKYDDFNDRQDAFHEKLMSDTDVALSLLRTLVGSVINRVPENQQANLQHAVAQRAEERGIPKDKVLTYMDEVDKSSRDPVSIAEKFMRIANDDKLESERRALSEEHYKLLAEFKEILSTP